MNTQSGQQGGAGQQVGVVLDVLGVGFGPSNLALALAIEEHNAAGGSLAAEFVEQQEQFGWHRGMLIPGATMQVHYLKDLVTMRDPTSPASFLCYLHEHDRVADFINCGSSYPTRLEFHDYFEWAARRVSHLVSYGTRAVAVLPVREGPDADVTAFDVVLRDSVGSDGATRTVRTRALVVASGLQPSLPDGVERGPRVWHTSELLPRLAEVDAGGTDAEVPRTFVVVGAGQSAAETAAHLHERPGTQVHAVFARYGYSPADDSAFANRIFDPEAVDDFHEAPPEVRAMLMDYHANTNYSCVDGELIDELYRRAYAEKVAGDVRLHVRRASRVTKVRVPDDEAPVAWERGGLEIDVEFLPTGAAETVGADVVVYATGYRPVDPTGLLGEIGAWCRRGPDGELVVERDYRIASDGPLDAPIYLQGPTEHSHGISSTLLSNSAVRAGEILDSLLAR